jgi:hypothetical protein
MEITLESLQERLGLLRKAQAEHNQQRDYHSQQVVLIAGAISDIEHWVQLLSSTPDTMN